MASTPISQALWVTGGSIVEKQASEIGHLPDDRPPIDIQIPEWIADLARYSMVRSQDRGGEPAFSIHGLVQAVERLSLSKEQYARTVTRVSELLVEQGIAGAHFVDHLLKFKPLLPHAEALWANARGKAEDAIDLDFLDGLAKLAHWLHSGEKSTDYAAASLFLRKKHLGAEHPDTLISLHELANAYRSAGNPSKAEALYRECLGLKDKIFGWEHRETLATAECLANIIAPSKPEEAISLMDRAIPVMEHLSGPHDTDVLTCMMSLAKACSALGNRDRAISVLKEVADRLEVSPYPETPVAAIVWGDLAAEFHQADRLMEAEPLYRKALELQVELSRFLRQPVKTQNPSNGELSHGIVS